jgi:hypothetical protein
MTLLQKLIEIARLSSTVVGAQILGGGGIRIERKLKITKN